MALPSTSRFFLFAFAGAVSILAGTVSPARSQVNAFESFRNALIDYFGTLNFVPVLVDRGYSVGDVIEADGVNFMARGSQCFPHLKASAPVVTSLPEIVKVEAARLSFGLMLKQLFNSNVGAALVK